MHLMHVHLIVFCCKMNIKVQNQYMKEMLSKAFDRKQITQNFYVKCLKWDLKDSPICLDLAYFQPKNKIEK